MKGMTILLLLLERIQPRVRTIDIQGNYVLLGKKECLGVASGID